MARAQKRISKREIRQDPVIKTVTQARSWVDLHSTLVIIGALALVVIVVGVLMYGRMKRSSNDQAQLALAQARQLIVTNRKDQAIQLFEEAAARYKGTQGGAEALFSLAELAMSDGDREKALELYQEFEKKYSDEFMLGLGALYAEGAALEDLERYDEAAGTFDRLFLMDTFGNVKPFALYEAGRCWSLAGDFDQARERFQRLLDEFPDNALKSDAERELAKAEVKLEG